MVLIFYIFVCMYLIGIIVLGILLKIAETRPIFTRDEIVFITSNYYLSWYTIYKILDD